VGSIPTVASPTKTGANHTPVRFLEVTDLTFDPHSAPVQ
jgi:hypothetical protein